MKSNEYLRQLAEIIARSAQARRPRSGPRSRVVEAIAVLLYSGPMRAAEIASILGLSSRYVSSYLSYWKSRGLFLYENGYWMLTEEGRRFAESVIKRYEEERNEKYMMLARSILSGPTPPTRNDNNKYHRDGQYPGFLPSLATATSTPVDAERVAREHCGKRVLESYSKLLPSDELEILEALVKHFTEWGKTYLYLEQLQAELDADPHWLLAMLRKLQSKGLIYVYHDKRMGIRIGFSKHLRSLIDNCLSASNPA